MAYGLGRHGIYLDRKAHHVFTELEQLLTTGNSISSNLVRSNGGIRSTLILTRSRLRAYMQGVAGLTPITAVLKCRESAQPLSALESTLLLITVIACSLISL